MNIFKGVQKSAKDLVKDPEEFIGFRMFRNQIERDVASGILEAHEGERLIARFVYLRGYARMQIALYTLILTQKLGNSGFSLWNFVMKIASKIAWGTTGSVWIDSLKDLAWDAAQVRVTVDSMVAFDPQVSRRIMWSPGMLAFNLLPGMNKCIGNIAMLKAEPALHDVALRVCERFYRNKGLDVLNPIFVRPCMRALKWLYSLNWPRIV